MDARKSFASDNNAGVHPRVLTALAEANRGHCVAYGDDPYTPRAVAKFRECFGEKAEVFFVFNGTAANVLGLKAMTEPFHSVICSEMAHIYVDECGAPERFLGCKLLPVSTPDGKIGIDGIRKYLAGKGDQHHVQARVISISQTTELGTVYSLNELKTLTGFAKENGLLVHVDGARFVNAAASLGVSLRGLATETNIDVLSFGGTKNGLLFGEAVVFFDPGLAANFKFIRKQGLNLASKMRFVSAQFIELLSNDLWLENARHANRMAALLESRLKSVPEIQILRKVEANAVFAAVPRPIIAELQKRHFFYVWNEERREVRWMTSFDTTEDDVNGFVESIKKCLSLGRS